MQYLLMLYSNEAGWSKMTQAEQERGVAAYQAFSEALSQAGCPQGLKSPSADFKCNDCSRCGWQVAGA